MKDRSGEKSNIEFAMGSVKGNNGCIIVTCINAR